VRALYEFRVGDEVFHVRVDDGTIEATHGPAQRPDAIVETDDAALTDTTAGGSAFAEALERGDASASGDPAALRALPRLFRRPEPAAR
jgi:alkyl sulfatase BDS1-like metallo-beta-lactamase superfamily hydrolase